MSVDPTARGLAAGVRAGLPNPAAGMGDVVARGATRGIRYAALGDSISADPFSANASGSNFTSWGFLAWFRRYMGQAIDFPGSRIYATAGYTIQNVIDNWLPLAVADTSQVVIVHVGTNSLGSGTNAQLWAQLQTIYDALRAKGKAVIAIPIRVHRTPSSITGNNLLQFSWLNEKIKSYSRSTTGMFCFDVNDTYIDFATGDGVAALYRDGIHDSVQGAQAFGQKLATFVSGLFPSIIDKFTHLGDVYDATYNPTGNLLTNGLLAGTSGTLANGATGSVATGSRGLRSAGGGTMSAAFSKGTIAGLVNCPTQIMTLGGTADGALAQLDQTFSNNFAVGDVVQLSADVSYVINSGTINGIFADLRAYTSGFATLFEALDGSYNGSNGAYASGSGSFSLKTEPFAIPATTFYLNPVLGVAPGTSGTIDAVVTWSRAALRKVV